MRQLVIDTNVLVAALRSRRGASYQLLATLGSGSWQPNLSVALALEYEDVLKRKGLIPGLTPSDVDQFLDYFFKFSNLLPFVVRRRPQLPDPDDDRILEVALQSQATIITYNKRDFAGADRLGILVQTPSEFLRWWGAPS